MVALEQAWAAKRSRDLIARAHEEAHPRRDEVDVGMVGQESDLKLQFAWMPEVVAVQEGDEVSTCGGDPLVPGTAQPRIPLNEDTHPGVAHGNRQRVIGGAGVHHQNLLDRVGLGDHRCKGLRQKAAAVEGGDDDTDLRSFRHGRFS